MRVTLDIVATVATAVAAVLAWITIREAKRQAATAQAALLHERRVDHTIDQLTAIALENHKSSNVSWADAELAVRASPAHHAASDSPGGARDGVDARRHGGR